MNTIRRVIGEHQIASFFVLTLFFVFGISIPALYLLPFDGPASDVVQFCFVQLMLFGPAISGIVITKLTSTERVAYSRRSRWLAFIITFLIASLISWQTRFRYDSTTIEIINSVIRSLIPAYIISMIFAGSLSIREYLSTIVRPRGNLVWYVVAVFTFPTIHVLGNVITWTLNSGSMPSNSGSNVDVVFATGITFFSVLFFSGGLNEETGWRGFVLPRLQARYSPLVATLVIWLVHAVWELPGDVLFSGSSWPAVSRLIWMPSWSILFMWVFNRTNGSILAPMLFHASMNSMNTLSRILPPTNAGTILLVGFALSVVIIEKMWRRLPPDSPAVVGRRMEASIEPRGAPPT